MAPTNPIADAIEDPVVTLRYWMDVEALTPPSAEDDREADDTFEARHAPVRDLPWHDPSFGNCHCKYIHFVRFGIFARERYEADLVSALSTHAEEDHDTKPASAAKRFCCTGVFSVDDNGTAVPGSLVLPEFGLMYERLLAPSPVEIDDELEAFRRHCRSSYDGLALEYNQAARKVDTEFVAAVQAMVAQTLTWLNAVPATMPSAVVRSSVCRTFTATGPAKLDAQGVPQRTGKWRDKMARLPPMGSFYFGDLRLVMRAVQNRNGGLVERYLSGRPERNDCTEGKFIEGACTAATHPPGRWPSQHGMSLMQQVAVDLAMTEVAEGGLFAVNGPPGTGKTTLLMDIVAAVVVGRATAMCAFAKPADAFTREAFGPGRRDSGAPFVHALHESLLDHLVVVASGNNGAVENVTRELPSLAKVAPRHLDGFQFFAPTADALLRSKKPGDADEGDDEADDDGGPEPGPQANSWGLISAALGKKANRTRFVGVLQREERGNLGPAPCNLFRQLEEARPGTDWKSARAGFRRAADVVAALSAEISAAKNPTVPTPARIAELERVRAEAASAEQRMGAALSAADAIHSDAQSAFDRAERGVDLLQAAKPSWVASIFGRGREWRLRMAGVVEERAGADRALGAAERARQEARSAAGTARSSFAATSQAVKEARRQAIEAEAAARLTVLRHPGLVTPADVAHEPDEGARQAMLPGSSQALSDARAALFVSAMRVHLAFVCAAGPDVFDHNLRIALRMLAGDQEVRGLVQRSAPHLWATLALVTPVVSTTFASLARTFQFMGMGSIPWLLIDEAGQAVPHQAVGALWRAKRAIVVGDPFQVEPVAGIDANADAKLQERRGAPERHRATLSSAQKLADAASRFGCMASSEGAEPTWVGCPLRVHRRCVEPMFGIANRMAYGGGMFLAADKEPTEVQLTASRPLLGPSCWYDVTEKAGGPKHFIPSQAEAVSRLVGMLIEEGVVDEDGLPVVFAVSPFRSMADGLRGRLQADLAKHGLQAHAAAWAATSVGTVHTFQGKERETVVLALGGVTEGAIRWASATPNILNVAVTRAQRRLYVVGDRKRWMAASSLMQHMATLPLVGWPPVPAPLFTSP